MALLMFIINHGCTNNAHYFLCIISSMTQTEKCRRNQLQSAEPFVGFIWICLSTNIYDGNRNYESQ